MLNHVASIVGERLQAGASIAPLLSFVNVSHAYTREDAAVEALRDIDLSIEPGEFVAIVGASGCGKSTLLRIAAGLLKPSMGQAMFSGARVERPTSDVSMIFQDAVMLPWFSVLENVALPERIARRDMNEARGRARSLLKSVGLGEFADSVSRSAVRRNATACGDRARTHDAAQIAPDG